VKQPLANLPLPQHQAHPSFSLQPSSDQFVEYIFANQDQQVQQNQLFALQDQQFNSFYVQQLSAPRGRRLYDPLDQKRALHDHQLFAPRNQDPQILELQQHLHHQQASHKEIIHLKDKLYESEISRLNMENKQLRFQLESPHHQIYHPSQHQQLPPIKHINQQLRYQPQQQIYGFDGRSRSRQNVERLSDGMKSKYFM
jgi:hypothetical protein